jgi:hypothetical protein
MRKIYLFVVAAIACCSVACPTPVQPPVPPDVGSLGGSPGIGGTSTIGGSTNAGGSPGIGGATQPTCSNACCRTCALLRDHNCTEGTPTAEGLSCEARNYCDGSKTLPPTLALADLTTCTTLACIRNPGSKKRGVTCAGGK